MSSKPRGNNEPDWGFDWPPKQRIVPSEIVELEKSTVQSKTPPAPLHETLDNPLLEFNTRSPLPLPLPVRLPQPQPSVALPPQAPQPPQETPPLAAQGIAREELPHEVQEELRGLDADFWGPIALEGYLKRGWLMPAAIVALTVVALVEGVFLLRGPAESTYIVSQAAPAPQSAAPAASQPTNPAPTGTTPIPLIPSGRATASASIPPTSTSRQPGARDSASGRAIQPRSTPAAETTRPAPVRPVPTPAAAQPSVQAPGWITVSAPIELNVSEKDSLLGSTRGPRILLRAGGHVLQLENTALGYRENQWVRIHAGKETTLPITLPQGVVHVNATPWADISIDGKSFGQTPIGNLKLTIGPHDVVFRHPNLGEKTVSALVKVGAPTRVSADLTQR